MLLESEVNQKTYEQYFSPVLFSFSSYLYSESFGNNKKNNWTIMAFSFMSEGEFFYQLHCIRNVVEACNKNIINDRFYKSICIASRVRGVWMMKCSYDIIAITSIKRLDMSKNKWKRSERIKGREIAAHFVAYQLKRTNTYCKTISLSYIDQWRRTMWTHGLVKTRLFGSW